VNNKAEKIIILIFKLRPLAVTLQCSLSDTSFGISSFLSSSATLRVRLKKLEFNLECLICESVATGSATMDTAIVPGS
jgi:hypothetical protein